MYEASPKDSRDAAAGALHAILGSPKIGLTSRGCGAASQAVSVPSTVTVKRAISDLVNILVSPVARCTLTYSCRRLALTPFHSWRSRQGVRIAATPITISSKGGIPLLGASLQHVSRRTARHCGLSQSEQCEGEMR